MNCKHTYHKNSILDSKESNICPYSKLYEQLTKDNHSIKPLPIDNAGKCLFHSHDTEWKKENHFLDRFLELIEILEQLEYKVFDFRDFLIVNDSNTVIDIKNIQRKQVSLDFTGAIFKSRIRFLNLDINNLILNDTLFEKNLSINETTLFSSLNFERVKVKGEFYLRDTEIGFNAYFSNTKFLKPIELSNSLFLGDVFFLKTVFSFTEIDLSEHDEPYCRFSNLKFNHSVNFEEALFDCGFEAVNVSFNGDVQFLQTKFSEKYYTVFRLPVIKENLSFIGSEKDKLFPYGAIIELKVEDIQGQIIFENVNFKNIKEENRNVLKELSYTDKVSIGSGCIKYRNQTNPRTIHIKSSIQTLLFELVNTYSSFFGEHNGFNLGFEIIERAEDKITFFYFSDENIAEEVFLERLQKTEVDFWTIIENPNVLYNPQPVIECRDTPQKEQSLTIDKTPSDKLQKFVEEFPYAKDLLINIASFFLKINVRITHNNLDDKDLNNLLQPIQFSDYIKIDIKKVIEMILESFGIKMLMGRKEGLTNIPRYKALIKKLDDIKKGQEEIKQNQKEQTERLDDIRGLLSNLEENFIANLTDELKYKFEEIKESIHKENKKDGIAIANMLMGHIDKAKEELTQQDSKIYSELKKSSDWKAKIKFGTPIFAKYLTGAEISIEKEYNLTEGGKILLRKIKELLEKYPTLYPKRSLGRI